MPYRRLYDGKARAAHRLAMDAKQLVFRAQDNAAQLPTPPTTTGRSASSGLRRINGIHTKITRELAKARAALERLDNLMVNLQTEDNDHCSCGAFPHGLDHKPSCPLGEQAPSGS